MDLNEFIESNPDAKAAVEKMVSDQASTATATATKGLKDKTTVLMDELKPLKELRAQLGADFSIDDYNALIKTAADKKKKGHVEKGEIDNLVSAHDSEKEKWKSSYDKDIGDRDTQIKGLTSEVERLVVDGELSRELGAIAVDKGALEYLMFKAKPLIEITDVNGQKVARVKDGVKGDGTYKTIKDLVADFGADEANARYIKGTGHTGSGASGSDAGGVTNGKTITRQAFDSLGPVDRAKFFKDGGKVN